MAKVKGTGMLRAAGAEALSAAYRDAPLVVEVPSPAAGADGRTTEAIGFEIRGGELEAMIAAGAAIPCATTLPFSTAVDGQAAIDLVLYRGNDWMAVRNHALGTFRIAGIRPAPRGVPRLAITLAVVERQVLLSGRDLDRGVALQVQRIPPEAPAPPPTVGARIVAALRPTLAVLAFGLTMTLGVLIKLRLERGAAGSSAYLGAGLRFVSMVVAPFLASAIAFGFTKEFLGGRPARKRWGLCFAPSFAWPGTLLAQYGLREPLAMWIVMALLGLFGGVALRFSKVTRC